MKRSYSSEKYQKYNENHQTTNNKRSRTIDWVKHSTSRNSGTQFLPAPDVCEKKYFNYLHMTGTTKTTIKWGRRALRREKKNRSVPFSESPTSCVTEYNSTNRTIKFSTQRAKHELTMKIGLFSLVGWCWLFSNPPAKCLFSCMCLSAGNLYRQDIAWWINQVALVLTGRKIFHLCLWLKELRLR